MAWFPGTFSSSVPRLDMHQFVRVPDVQPWDPQIAHGWSSKPREEQDYHPLFWTQEILVQAKKVPLWEQLNHTSCNSCSHPHQSASLPGGETGGSSRSLHWESAASVLVAALPRIYWAIPSMWTLGFHSVKWDWEVNVFHLDDPKNPFLLKFYDEFVCICYTPTLKDTCYLGKSELSPVSVKSNKENNDIH